MLFCALELKSVLQTENALDGSQHVRDFAGKASTKTSSWAEVGWGFSMVALHLPSK